jgi:hypothetical protein
VLREIAVAGILIVAAPLHVGAGHRIAPFDVEEDVDVILTLRTPRQRILDLAGVRTSRREIAIRLRDGGDLNGAVEDERRIFRNPDGVRPIFRPFPDVRTLILDGVTHPRLLAGDGLAKRLDLDDLEVGRRRRDVRCGGADIVEAGCVRVG